MFLLFMVKKQNKLIAKQNAFWETTKQDFDKIWEKSP